MSEPPSPRLRRPSPASLGPRHPGPPARRGVITRDEAASLARELQQHRQRVVFTNGVFDLLHPGHLRYLTAARAAGDYLIVGVNSDRSVRANKGPLRPINPDYERAEVIAALDVVDAAVVFDEDTPAEIIRAIQPDVLVKGADWAADAIVGRDTVESRGGGVIRIPVEEGFSTTALLHKVKDTSS